MTPHPAARTQGQPRVTKRHIDRLAALVTCGEILPEDAHRRLDGLLRSCGSGCRAWANGRLEWGIRNPLLVGSLMRTLIVADGCASAIPDWCGGYTAGRHLFAVACMQGGMAYNFQMAGSGYARTLVYGATGTPWGKLTTEQRREIDRIKKLVRRFVRRAIDEGFMRQVGEGVKRPHGYDAPRAYALTRDGIEAAERVLRENPKMMDYAKSMGWYNEDGLPY